jgi:hypothetical protein
LRNTFNSLLRRDHPTLYAKLKGHETSSYAVWDEREIGGNWDHIVPSRPSQQKTRPAYSPRFTPVRSPKPQNWSKLEQETQRLKSMARSVPQTYVPQATVTKLSMTANSVHNDNNWAHVEAELTQLRNLARELEREED